jgi:hypothetical protein
MHPQKKEKPYNRKFPVFYPEKSPKKSIKKWGLAY